MTHAWTVKVSDKAQAVIDSFWAAPSSDVMTVGQPDHSGTRGDDQSGRSDVDENAESQGRPSRKRGGGGSQPASSKDDKSSRKVSFCERLHMLEILLQKCSVESARARARAHTHTHTHTHTRTHTHTQQQVGDESHDLLHNYHLRHHRCMPLSRAREDYIRHLVGILEKQAISHEAVALADTPKKIVEVGSK
jgi:hypothetical protein